MSIFIDFGTSSIKAVYNCDFNNIFQFPNPQQKFGNDIVTRLESFEFHDNKNSIRKLGFDSIKKVINHYSDFNTDVQIVGNTGIISMFFDCNIEKLLLAPHKSPVKDNIIVSGENIFGSVFNNKLIFNSPIEGFVGSDLLSNALWLNDFKTPVILIDLGTNIEVLLKNDEAIYFTSVSGGPAFENDHINCVSKWKKRNSEFKIISQISPKNNTISVNSTEFFYVIDYLIDKKILSVSGKLQNDVYLKTTYGSLKISQMDIRNFQYAKGAVLAAIMTLIEKTDFRFKNPKIIITGNFGSALNPVCGQKIGFFPSHMEILIQPNSIFMGMNYLKNNILVKNIRNNCRYIPMINNILFNDIFIKSFEFREYELS